MLHYNTISTCNKTTVQDLHTIEMQTFGAYHAIPSLSQANHILHGDLVW